MTHRLALALAVVLSGLVAHARLARADGPAVAIAVDDVGDPVARRLQAELIGLGFAATLERAPAAAPSRALLEANARDRGAIAAFRIVTSPTGVEVWIFDRVTRKTLQREVTVQDVPDPAERAEVVATRAVELLRASLMELNASHQVFPEVEVPRAARALAQPAPPPRPAARLALAVGPALALSPGGVGPTGHAVVELRARTVTRLWASARVVLPVVTSTVEDSLGRASVSPLLVGGSVDLELETPSPALQATVRAGAALALLRMEGESALAGVDARSDTTTSALPWVGATLRLRLGARVLALAAIDAGAAFPRPAVRFAGQRIATWGAPLVLTTVALEFEGP